MQTMKVRKGFWNCCIARPAKAIKFVSDTTGKSVYYAACASCASTVTKDRVKSLGARFHREQYVARLFRAYRAGDIAEILYVANLAYDYGRTGNWMVKALDVIKACDGTNWHRILQTIITLNLYAANPR